MSDNDDIQAALEARAAQGSKSDDSTDDIDAALKARAAGTSLTKIKDDAKPKSKYEQALEPTKEGPAGFINGLTEAAGKTILGAPAAAARGVVDLARRAHVPGTDPVGSPMPGAIEAITPELSQNAQNAVGAVDSSPALSTLAAPVTFATDKARQNFPNASAVAGDALNILPVAGALGSRFMGGAAKVATVGDAQAAADAALAKQSMGAAKGGVDVTSLSPETQLHLAEIHNGGGKVNPTALANHAEAETLPVPVKMTQGQALEDEAIKTQEHNSKQEHPEIGKRFDEQDNALRENLDTFHREAAPTAVGNDVPTNDQSMIDSLKRYDAPKKQAITEAYSAAKEANGGDLQMDGSQFVSDSEAALKPQGKSRFLPSTVKGIIDDVKESGGKMSLDDFEGYRTALANESRKASRAGDGNAVAAINKVRDVLEDTSPAGDASASAKKLYDKARGMAKSRFQEMKDDPAYEAAVSDETPAGQLSDQAGKFGSKYVLNGAKANLQRMRAKLDEEGQESMTSTGFGVLKDKAGTAKDKFIQNGYNTALETMRRKGVAEELLGNSDNVENASKLGRVARKVQTYSRGAAPNTSGTLTGALAREGVDIARGVLPGHVNTGINLLGRHVANVRAAHDLHATLRAGAGLAD